MPAMSIALANRNRMNYSRAEYSYLCEIKKTLKEIRKSKIWFFNKKSPIKNP